MKQTPVNPDSIKHDSDLIISVEEFTISSAWNVSIVRESLIPTVSTMPETIVSTAGNATTLSSGYLAGQLQWVGLWPLQRWRQISVQNARPVFLRPNGLSRQLELFMGPGIHFKIWPIIFINLRTRAFLTIAPIICSLRCTTCSRQLDVLTCFAAVDSNVYCKNCYSDEFGVAARRRSKSRASSAEKDADEAGKEYQILLIIKIENLKFV